MASKALTDIALQLYKSLGGNLSNVLGTRSNINFLGKDKLKKIEKEGIKRKLMGVLIETDKINLTTSLNIKDNNNNFIGELRSACYSPHFKKVIGIAMINQPYCKASESGIIEIDGNSLSLKVCDLPFI